MMPLVPYAASDQASRGRRFSEPGPRYRSEFQRDRDRIIHSSAFRRLEYKTQVFVNHEGDMFRTRLTHSIEVAQIGRAIARALRLNEDLVEAITLAHDLGHTPFGHAGQDALNDCMREYGGFEHNLQSLRVVDELEEKYADFPGLNLTYETREGILKHCSQANARELGALGQRFLEKTQPSLEAQIANIADAIAYNNHDVDDGLRAGLLDLDQLRSQELFAGQFEQVTARHPKLGGRRLVHETIRRIINEQVVDLLEFSSGTLGQARVSSIDEVRAQSEPLIRFSPGMRDRHQGLKQFLRREMYQHYRVHRMMTKAQQVIRDLFAAFFSDPRLLPPEHQQNVRGAEENQGEKGKARAVADYIAGMTDRYAISVHRKLFDAMELT